MKRQKDKKDTQNKKTNDKNKQSKKTNPWGEEGEETKEEYMRFFPKCTIPIVYPTFLSSLLCEFILVADIKDLEEKKKNIFFWLFVDMI